MKHTLLLLCCFFTCAHFAAAQKNDRAYIDSLLTVITHAKNDTQKVNLYNDIMLAHGEIQPAEGFKYEQPALALAEKLRWKDGTARTKINAGHLYYYSSNFDEALKRYFEALKLYEQLRDSSNIADALANIGQTYADAGNYPEALEYFSKSLTVSGAIDDSKKQAYLYSLIAWVHDMMGEYTEYTKANLASLKIYEQLGDFYGIAVTTSNLADYYFNMGNYDIALQYYEKSVDAVKKDNDIHNLCSFYLEIGKIYQNTAKPDAAMKYYQMSLDLATEVKDTLQIAAANEYLGNWKKKEGKWQKALQYFLTAANHYRSVSNKQQLATVLSSAGSCYARLLKYREANTCFAEAQKLSAELNSPKIRSFYMGEREILDSALGNWKNAYFNYKLHILTRDSMDNIANSKKTIELNMQYEYDKKETAAKVEQDKKDLRQKNIRNSITAGFGGALIFLIVVYRQRNKISKARKRSDELLLNILPQEVAEELKQKGSAEAKQFDEVTVMFTDFKGFTQISEKLSPAELVAEIDRCFKAFDHIIEKHNIEKIKTIGDSYMCAGGLPVVNKTHADDVVSAALEIQQYMHEHIEERRKQNKEVFEIRIGIHTGPVVAGIVGVKKFAYDIWGDTVNIASRMESSGETGKVNISGSTYALVKDKFQCDHRGKIEAKNRGMIDMYFVKNLQ
ncbi:MAG: tetratricopeptide repeat protein [Fimbriimonadaceae bacterium]|nr:tetratricopeptide repeat protein [Chitinophagales bacterium]